MAINVTPLSGLGTKRGFVFPYLSSPQSRQASVFGSLRSVSVVWSFVTLSSLPQRHWHHGPTPWSHTHNPAQHTRGNKREKQHFLPPPSREFYEWLGEFLSFSCVNIMSFIAPLVAKVDGKARSITAFKPLMCAWLLEHCFSHQNGR